MQASTDRKRCTYLAEAIKPVDTNPSSQYKTEGGGASLKQSYRVFWFVGDAPSGVPVESVSIVLAPGVYVSNLCPWDLALQLAGSVASVPHLACLAGATLPIVELWHSLPSSCAPSPTLPQASQRSESAQSCGIHISIATAIMVIGWNGELASNRTSNAVATQFGSSIHVQSKPTVV
jgi:hypothetical protein